MAVGFDVSADDVAVVVFHRTDGGCWQVESAQGPAEDIMALVVAAAVPAPQVPDRLTPWRPWQEQIQEWMKYPERIQLDAGPVDRLRRMYSEQMLTGTLVHTSAATEPERPAWLTVDEIWADLHADDERDQARRYFQNQLLDEDAERRHHP